MKKMKIDSLKFLPRTALLALACVCAAAPAMAEGSSPVAEGSSPVGKGSSPVGKGSNPVGKGSNPVDKVSNPDALAFPDVAVGQGEFTEVFVRDGVVLPANYFREIVPGMTQDQVRAKLGEPLRQSDGKHGREWEYNFEFVLRPSSNFIVCQYKLVFDEVQQTVREQVWRRRQCQRVADHSNNTGTN